jgi:uncharacterized protein (UPF0276 family)
MSELFSSIACNLDSNILQAALPLFEKGEVEAIEWSFDALFRFQDIPNWFADLIRAYATEQRLIGHGVFFSIFSGKWKTEQEKWLAHLSEVARQFSFQHITEHFGFMTGENFHAGAPMSVPLNTQTLAIGRDRLQRIYEACHCPVGLENLAFAYSLEDVKQQGYFLEELLRPVNGFIILDLHNLYCQLYNFNVDVQRLIHSYPLGRVREIHISGGSWEDSPLTPNKRVRRDTHDDAVPEAVFQLLAEVIPLCPNLNYVVLEQIGTGLQSMDSHLQYQRDFRKMKAIVSRFAMSSAIQNDFSPGHLPHLPQPVEDELLARQQLELSNILENAADHQEAQRMLQASSLFQSSWHIENWAPHMLETALQIAQKWKA